MESRTHLKTVKNYIEYICSAEDGSSFIEFAQINVSEKQKNWYYVRNFRVNVGAVTNRALFPARDSIIEQWSQSNFEVVMQY